MVWEEDGDEGGELPPLPDEPLSSLGWEGPAVTSKSVFSLDILNNSWNCKMSTWTSASCSLLTGRLSGSTMSFKANMIIFFYNPMVCGRAFKTKKLK